MAVTERDDCIGFIKKFERIQNEDGKTVFRATVDFYNGNTPDITFGTVWSKRPVKIVEIGDFGEYPANKEE